MGRVLGAIAFLILAPAAVHAENFSCSFGRGACLDYGDKICSSQGKCVSDDAVCFDSFTCGYGGFVCKSKMDDLANSYDDLVRKAKSLGSEYDDLVAKHNDLIDDMSALQRRFGDAVTEKLNIESCLSSAASLEDAQACG